MDIQNLTRKFRYNSVMLADPNPTFSLMQVRDFYSAVYPELTSADIEGPERKGAEEIYTFRRAVGTKGASAREAALQRLRADGHLAPAARPLHVITAEQARSLVAAKVSRILDDQRRGAGPRCLAPSANHVVLP